jgi:hypothetical protein
MRLMAAARADLNKVAVHIHNPGRYELQPNTRGFRLGELCVGVYFVQRRCGSA